MRLGVAQIDFWPIIVAKLTALFSEHSYCEITVNNSKIEIIKWQMGVQNDPNKSYKDVARKAVDKMVQDLKDRQKRG